MTNDNSMFGIKLPDTAEEVTTRKFLEIRKKSTGEKSPEFPLTNAEYTNDDKINGILEYMKEKSDYRLNFIGLNGVSLKNDSTHDAIIKIAEYNLQKNS